MLEPQGIPLVGPQSGATYLFQNTPKNLFNVWPEYTIEGKLLGSFAQKKGLKKVGVLYQNDDFGQSLYKGVLASGLKPAKVITYDPTQTDFSPDAQQFKSAGVDGVIILAIPKPTISFLNAMAAINFKPVRIMSQVSAIPQSFSSAPQEFPGSYIGAFIPSLYKSHNPQVTQFEQAMAQVSAGTRRCRCSRRGGGPRRRWRWPASRRSVAASLAASYIKRSGERHEPADARRHRQLFVQQPCRAATRCSWCRRPDGQLVPREQVTRG